MTRLYNNLFGRGWYGHALALVAGACLPLSLAPYNFWPAAIVSTALFILSLESLTGRQCLGRAYAYGLGMFAAGVSWVYVSISGFGQAPPALAALLTLLFAAGLAIVFCLPFGLLGRFFNSTRDQKKLGVFLALPAIWLLGEWLRSWFLTGFPWLYLGYSQLETPLSGYAPVFGVMGVGLITLFCASSLALAIKWLSTKQRPALLLPSIGLSLALIVGGQALKAVEWTQVKGDAISVGMIQPNIPQEKKWDPDFYQPTLERLRRLSDPLWHNDWVIWPEAAIPKLYHRSGPILEEFIVKASETNTGLITGILYDDFNERKYFNSVIGMGRAQGIYKKTRLVPFGEYVPLENYLRGLIEFFDLPTSIISPWHGEQRGIQVGSVMVAPSLCYEIAYPALVATGARKGDVLLTISNDGWFGDSIGPHQHMQIAQMRALETGRYLIRATNNGLSAIVNPQGKITLLGTQFVQQSIEGEVYATRGLTPYVRYQDELILALALLLLIMVCGINKLQSQHSKKN